jgi:hypothetical protein
MPQEGPELEGAEIVSFDKLMGDAGQRNKFLFDTLGLPGS